MKHTLTALLLALITTTALAGDAEIRKSIESSFPGTKIGSITKSPINGLFEVVADGQQGPLVIYSDDKGEYVLVGDLLNVQSKRNLTRERMDKLTRANWPCSPTRIALTAKKRKRNSTNSTTSPSTPSPTRCRCTLTRGAKPSWSGAARTAPKPGKT